VFQQFILPEVTMYLVAILALLLLWQHYQMQIMAGRILAVDIFNGSTTRMYLYATPAAEELCEVCAQAHGRVFSPSQVAKKGFSPLPGRCKRSNPCPGALVGLYGGWLEARGILGRLRANLKKGRIQLSSDEVRAVMNGQWERSISAETDRLSVHMIEALTYEKINPSIAIVGYRYVIDQAKEVRQLMFLVVAYLRLVELLCQSGQHEKALEVMDRFDTRFPRTKCGPHFPTDRQREVMTTRKAHLLGKDRLHTPFMHG
jgi:hypothetical protein